MEHGYEYFVFYLDSSPVHATAPPFGWIPAIGIFLGGTIGMAILSGLAYLNGMSMNGESVNLLLSAVVVGALFEAGKRLCEWTYSKFKFPYFVTASFKKGDEPYDWIVHLLTNENVWKTADSRDSSKTSRYGDCIPADGVVRKWRWNGYRAEVTCSLPRSSCFCAMCRSSASKSINITIYTFDPNATFKLIEAARLEYLKTYQDIVVHSTELKYAKDSVTEAWNKTWRIQRPEPEYIVLDELTKSMIEDAREFIGMDEYYRDTGIPHQRGYLLHSPPGTDGMKSSIYALAGELGMEVYSISLSAPFIGDEVLHRAIQAIPENCIFLIEDVDSLAPWGGNFSAGQYPYVFPDKINVTISGLLKALDESRQSSRRNLLIATTQKIEHVHPDLIRAGRLDMAFEFKFPTKNQAVALFKRFYPSNHIKLSDTYRSASAGSDAEYGIAEKQVTVEDRIAELAESFAKGIPENKFSISQLKRYLLTYRKNPLNAVEGLAEWIGKELSLRVEKDVPIGGLHPLSYPPVPYPKDMSSNPE